MSKGEVSRAVPTAAQRLDTFRAELQKNYGRIAPLVPRGVTPDRIFAVASVAMSRSPLLLQCWTPSVIRAIAVGAQLGLDVSGVGGMGYLVPFKNRKHGGRYEAVFIAGYQGLIDLARRSRDVVTVRAKEVYQRDDLVYEEGAVPVLRHKPFPGGEPGPLVAAYAVAHYTNGFAQPEVLFGWQVEQIRKRSRAGDDGPWATDTAQMWRKTAIRRLCKLLPQNPDLSKAIEMEERAEVGEIDTDPITEALEEEPEEPEQSATEAIKGQLGIIDMEEVPAREPGEEG